MDPQKVGPSLLSGPLRTGSRSTTDSFRSRGFLPDTTVRCFSDLRGALRLLDPHKPKSRHLMVLIKNDLLDVINNLCYNSFFQYF